MGVRLNLSLIKENVLGELPKYIMQYLDMVDEKITFSRKLEVMSNN